MELHISRYKEHIQKMETDPIYREEFLLQIRWNNLKSFKFAEDVPALPIPLTDIYTNRLIDLGAIPLTELEDNNWYYGNYRNSNFGKWDDKNKIFHIIRYKWSSFHWDECKHFQNDDRFALFVPLRKATSFEVETEEGKV